MNQEIERKFLVTGNFKSFAESSVHIVQGYLSSVPERTVRVRIKGDRAFITVKGLLKQCGISRFEWEKEIAVAEAHALLKLCEDGVIDKIRYLVPAGKHTFEVDEFYGENQGLVIAEIELKEADEHFEKPSWLGTEVTGDLRYYNSMLASNPYTKWQATSKPGNMV